MLDNTRQFEINVLINDRPVDEYPHTDSYTYLEGRPGSKYELELVNNSYERVMFVPSVDGLNVLNGKAEWEDGYVLDPYNRIRIPGWRRDNTKVAAFEFSDAKGSYTNRMGNGASNTGVIGAMVFREDPMIMFSNASTYISTNSTLRGGMGLKTQSLNMAAPCMSVTASAKSMGSEMGTHWGEDTGFATKEVEFKRRDPNNPDAVIALYYDSVKGLERRGIRIQRVRTNPLPFPGYSSGGCTPPPGA